MSTYDGDGLRQTINKVQEKKELEDMDSFLLN